MVRPHGGTTLAGLVRSTIAATTAALSTQHERTRRSPKSRRFAAATAAGLAHPQQRQRLVAGLRRGLGLSFATTEFARLGGARLVLERRLLRGPPGRPKLYFRAFAGLRAGCSLVAAGSVPAVEDIRSLIGKSAQRPP